MKQNAIIMSFLTRWFGSNKWQRAAGGQSPSLRILVRTRAPPWHQIKPIVRSAIFDALDTTELFDSFVLESMENDLVRRYEQLGHNDRNVSVIRAKISAILCQTGFKKISEIQQELDRDRIEPAKKIGFSATNLFEAAIAMSNGQIGGYAGIAEVLGLLGAKAKSQDFARRGLLELQKVRQSATGQAMRDNAAFPPDMLDQAERQLRSYLE
jgi:hypothetical protein